MAKTKKVVKEQPKKEVKTETRCFECKGKDPQCPVCGGTGKV